MPVVEVPVIAGVEVPVVPVVLKYDVEVEVNGTVE